MDPSALPSTFPDCEHFNVTFSTALTQADMTNEAVRAGGGRPELPCHEACHGSSHSREA